MSPDMRKGVLPTRPKSNAPVHTQRKAVRELPWPIPAAVLVQMTDEDLDQPGRGCSPRLHWRILNGVVTRILERRLAA
jgi:hypothetical protein